MIVLISMEFPLEYWISCVFTGKRECGNKKPSLLVISLLVIPKLIIASQTKHSLRNSFLAQPCEITDALLQFSFPIVSREGLLAQVLNLRRPQMAERKRTGTNTIRLQARIYC